MSLTIVSPSWLSKAVSVAFLTSSFNPCKTTSFNETSEKIVNNLLKSLNVDGAKIYKEHEFVYEKEDVIYHGIIDLMLEYKDHIKIIDYKLKNIDDKEYLKQHHLVIRLLYQCFLLDIIYKEV